MCFSVFLPSPVLGSPGMTSFLFVVFTQFIFPGFYIVAHCIWKQMAKFTFKKRGMRFRECIISAFFPTPLISHTVFSLLRACPVAISNWISLAVLVRGHRHNWLGWQRQNVVTYRVIACTSASPFMRISKVATIRCNGHALAVAVLHL